MRNVITAVMAAGLMALVAAPALADSQPSSRDIQTAVDSYLADSQQSANLVGGPGSAGYDSGFWIRGGDFSLKTNLTLQARYEAFVYDADQPPNTTQGTDTGGELSGFSLPRATLKLSGTAPCNICYYMELEFGHFGRNAVDDWVARNQLATDNLGPLAQSWNFDTLREAWIEWCSSPAFNFRMGQIKTPNTRQLLTTPELQQFVDISIASAFVGRQMPGYTDRNRDHGAMIHGVFGCNDEWSYMFAVTNGDGGDSIRNVLDTRTSDNVALSGRLNWAFLKPIGYQEGSLNAQTCQWYGELGAWGFFYADRTDKPHFQHSDSIVAGVDFALNYGGLNSTFAFTWGTHGDTDNVAGKLETYAYLAQIGYHFPGTAWEIALRFSGYQIDTNTIGANLGIDGSVNEFAFGVNYYLNGHGNKLQLDFSWYQGSDTAVLIFDPYTGIPGNASAAFADNLGFLIRLQWQLAL